MNNATLYSESNDSAKYEANLIIDNYFKSINWRSDENILDIGSGDGNVLLDLLLPKFPKSFNKLIGMDVSKEMVQFVKNRCSDPKIDFVCQDIGSPKIPKEFHQYFDHIFSIYCIHWVQDQRQAFRNMFEMLKPGGEILLTFTATSPIYDVYEKMAKSNKWSPFMHNFKDYCSPYHKSKDAENELKSILKEQGFVIHLCQVVNRCYIFQSLTNFIGLISAINPFIKKLPEDAVTNYIDDVIKELRKIKEIKIEICKGESGEVEKVHFPYKMFVVFATKPL